MKKNIGNIDKTFRLLVAALIVVLSIIKVITGTWAIVLLIFAAVFILTSIVGTCPIFLPFSISTIEKKPKK